MKGILETIWQLERGQAMLRTAGARRLSRALRRCPSEAKRARRIASWTWDVTHERALSPADLFGGKAPVGAFIGLLPSGFWSEFARAHM